MRGLSILLLSLTVMCQFGCGSKDSGTSSNSVGSNSLFVAVKSTTPTFAATISQKPQSALQSLVSAMTFTDQAMNMAFQLLRDYTYPNDEGKVDMTNIYKVLWEAGRYLDSATSICSPLTVPVQDNAISPFAFGDFLGHTYNCGGRQAESGGYGSSVAYKDDGATKNMLASYKWAPDAAQQITIGVLQASYNDTTKDVQLVFSQTVNYPVGSSMGGSYGSGFATRTRITGNSGDHSFDLKIAMNNIFTGGTSINSTSLVGKGVSQGAGNYFLIRSGSNYYCLPAGATETDLVNIIPTDQAGAGATNCADYVSAVSAATPYDAGTDMPNIDLSDFNNGVAGTPFKYLMF